jgi:hypothetical protein
MALLTSSHGRSGICVAIRAVRGRAARSSLATSRAAMEAAQQSVGRGSSRCSAGWGRRTALGLPPGLRELALRLPSGPREPALRSPSGPRVTALGPPMQKGAEAGSTHAAVGAARAGAPVDVGAACGVARAAVGAARAGTPVAVGAACAVVAWATTAVASGGSHHSGRRRGHASQRSKSVGAACAVVARSAAAAGSGGRDRPDPRRSCHCHVVVAPLLPSLVWRLHGSGAAAWGREKRRECRREGAGVRP